MPDYLSDPPKLSSTKDVKWGSFLRDTTGKKKLSKPHMAPINDEGYLLPPHELSIKCVCRPFKTTEGYICHNHPILGVN
jgi:hypothetical protein